MGLHFFDHVGLLRLGDSHGGPAGGHLSGVIRHRFPGAAMGFDGLVVVSDPYLQRRLEL